MDLAEKEIAETVKGVHSSPFGSISGLVWNVEDWSMA